MSGEPIIPAADPVDPQAAERAGLAQVDAPENARGLAAERPGRRKAALGFIFVTAVLNVVSFGLIIPVLPQLVQLLAGGDTAHAAIYVGVFGAVFALMQFISSPISGALSDRFGRRPVLLLSTFGLGLDFVLMALAPSLAWLFVGRIISGVTAASFSTCNAYIADVTPPEKRAAAFGLMGSAFGIGFILGPLIGGYFGSIDLRLPFWIAAGMALLNGLYGLFVLPESLPRERRSAFQVKNANPLGSLKLYRSHAQLAALAGVLFLFYLAHQVLQSTSVLYVAYRYHWGPEMVGLSLAVTGVGSIVTQGLVVAPFVKRFGERGALYTGLFSGVIGFAIYALAAQGWQFWLGAPIFALMGLVGPGINGVMSRRVASTEQGRLQGANAGMMALAGLFGPILFTQVFAWSIGPRHHAPGLAFYLASGLLALGLLLALRVPKTVAVGAEAAA